MNLIPLANNFITYCTNCKNLSELTVKAYQIDLKQFTGFKDSIEITKEDINAYIESLHTQYKPKTARRKIATLKTFVRYLYNQDLIPVNPFDKIVTNFKEPKLLPKTIPAQTIECMLKKLYKSIDEAKTFNQKFVSVRNTALVELLFATGARISEICSLHRDDINLTEKTVKIYGKGSRERIIYIENKEVLDIMSQLLNYKINSDYLFTNNRDNRLSEQSARNMIRQLGNEVGVTTPITPHMFRHTFATLLLENMVDIRYIQSILGHSTIVTTQIYTYVSQTKQREILKTKHPRNNLKIT